MRRLSPTRLIAALAVCGALAIAGCGLGPGGGTADTSLRVTQSFGETSLLDTTHPQKNGEDTVMRLLERNAKVTTRYGGGFVQSIDGRGGGGTSDWFYFVNGILAPKGAADTEVSDGDRVWWDRHDWSQTQRVPAVVGSYPEPFVHGQDGKRFPVLVECAQLQSEPCDAVVKALSSLGIVAARNRIRASFVQHSLRVLVGPWVAVRDDATVQLMEKGPAASGVYAKPAADGRSISVLRPDGSVAEKLGAGTGLVAATATQSDPPIWVVTGTDAAGVSAAASALDEGTLADRYALAISGGRGIHVPDTRPAP